MSGAEAEAASIVRRSTDDASTRKRESSPAGRCRAGMGLSSLAKAFQVLRILGEVLRQAFDRTGKVAGQVVARRRRGPRWLAQGLFQVVPDEPGFRHPPQLSLVFELSQKIVRQFQ